jgi:DNA-binding NarL/FixJ family response regulator
MTELRVTSRQGIAGDEIKFLIVDDDQISVMSIKRALKKLEIINPVRVAKDGIEALDVLRGSSECEQLEPPYIIVLDINMPRMNGLEFLSHVRQDAKLSEAVIFILTTSDAKSDIDQAYGNNVAGYILKDNMNASLEASVHMIANYSKMVILPA